MSPTMLATRPTSARESEMPVTRLIEVLGTELTELADLADGLQDAVAAVALGRQAPSAEFLLEAQSLDLVVQHLRALALFLGRVGPALDPAWSLDPSAAAGEITLASLAGRLGAPLPHSASEPADAGSFHLF